MINHCRTLLLNRSGDKFTNQGRWAEYVPPDFLSTSYPSSLAKIQKTLIPDEADIDYINFRVRQLLFAVHATEYGSELLKFDSRITYLRDRQDSVLNPSANIDTISNPGNAHVTLSGGFIPSYLRLNFTCRVLWDGSVLTAADGYGNTVVGTGSWAGTTGPTVSVPNCLDLKVTIHSSTGVAPAGTEWLLGIRLNPHPFRDELSEIPEIIKQKAYEELSGLLSQSRFSSWFDIWNNHPLVSYRLAAVVVPWCIAAEEYRNA